MTTPRIILTLAQAPSIQRNEADWSEMAWPEPEKPDTIPDPERMVIGLAMKARGCEDDQIAEQLGWKPGSTPLRTLSRLYKRR